jgi:uncharacterized protein (DUF2336 family)
MVMPLNDNIKCGFDVSVFETVLNEGAPEMRAQLAAEMARLLARPQTPDSDREGVTPYVLKLAVDPVADVRRVLAGGLLACKTLHSDIAFTVIADDDEIALPFLAQTPALNCWMMCAIMKVGDVPRKMTVAARPDISPEAIQTCVEHGEMIVNVALFDNPAVSFNYPQYRRLFDRFPQAPEIVERLLACPDLPLDIRIMQARRAANRIHQLMAERGWMAVSDASETIADAEETAILDILIDADPKELSEVVAFLTSRNMLTPSIIIRAGCLGEMRIVERALGHLADLPQDRTRHLLYARSAQSFRTLHAKSGLPQSCFGLLRAAAEVAREFREEGLRANAETFGRRLIEALMTRYEQMPMHERTKHLEIVGRFGAEQVRMIARRLRADLQRAA